MRDHLGLRTQPVTELAHPPQQLLHKGDVGRVTKPDRHEGVHALLQQPHAADLGHSRHSLEDHLQGDVPEGAVRSLCGEGLEADVPPTVVGRAVVRRNQALTEKVQRGAPRGAGGVPGKQVRELFLRLDPLQGLQRPCGRPAVHEGLHPERPRLLQARHCGTLVLKRGVGQQPQAGRVPHPGLPQGSREERPRKRRPGRLVLQPQRPPSPSGPAGAPPSMLRCLRHRGGREPKSGASPAAAARRESARRSPGLCVGVHPAAAGQLEGLCRGQRTTHRTDVLSWRGSGGSGCEADGSSGRSNDAALAGALRPRLWDGELWTFGGLISLLGWE
eukprot:RCo022957